MSGNVRKSSFFAIPDISGHWAVVWPHHIRQGHYRHVQSNQRLCEIYKNTKNYAKRWSSPGDKPLSSQWSIQFAWSYLQGLTTSGRAGDLDRALWQKVMYLRDYCIVLYNSLCFYTSHKASGSIGRVYNVPSICGGVIPLSNVPKCPELQKKQGFQDISGHWWFQNALGEILSELVLYVL